MKINLTRKDYSLLQVLNESEFVSFYYKLMRRPEIDDIFRRYAKNSNQVINQIEI